MTYTSTVSALLTNIERIKLNQTNFDLHSARVATGKKFQELRDYRADAYRIVSFRQEKLERESYIESANLAQTQTSSYTAVLTDLAKTASSLISTATNVLTSQEDPPPNLQGTISEHLLVSVEAVLNSRIGDRYIFGGENYKNPPVRDLATLANYPGSQANQIPRTETANVVPYFDLGGTNQSYISSFTTPGQQDQELYQASEITINISKKLSYGVSAAEPAFQKLIDGLLRLRSSAQKNLTVQERKHFIENARQLGEQSLREIRQLEASNGRVHAELESSKGLHNSFLSIIKTTTDNITTANVNESATALAALSTQLQASYSTIAKAQQLSLVHFLRNS